MGLQSSFTCLVFLMHQKIDHHEQVYPSRYIRHDGPGDPTLIRDEAFYVHLGLLEGVGTSKQMELLQIGKLAPTVTRSPMTT